MKTGDQLGRSFGYLLHQSSRKRRTFFDNQLRSIGITRSQLVMLQMIQHMEKGGAINQRILANELEMNEASLREKVVLLEQAKLIERRVDPDDRRHRIILITDRGRQKIDQSLEIVNSVNQEILSGISTDDIGVSEKVLRKIISNISRAVLG